MDYTTNFAPAVGAAVFPPLSAMDERGEGWEALPLSLIDDVHIGEALPLSSFGGEGWSLDIFRRTCSEVASRKWPSSRSDVLKVAVRL